jgi:hypothetical protein
VYRCRGGPTHTAGWGAAPATAGVESHLRRVVLEAGARIWSLEASGGGGVLVSDVRMRKKGGKAVVGRLAGLGGEAQLGSAFGNFFIFFLRFYENK